MAAANKPTAVHFSLVFFVTVTLVLIVTTYLGFKKNFEKEAQLNAKIDELGKQNDAVTKFRTETDALKQKLGTNLSGIGTDASDPNTVYGALDAAMQKYGGEQVGQNLLLTLTNMRAALDNLAAEKASLQAALNENKSQLTSVESGADTRVEEFKKSQESSEQQLQANIAARRQAIDEKNAEIDQLKKENADTKITLGQVQDQLDRTRRDNEERITLLEKQIDFYKDEIDQLTKQGFEREDGRVVAVDNSTRTVWINIGSAEGLKEQISFSVFTADHHGIGRDIEDIKGKIEVTRILEPHLSVARILDEDLFRPMAEGDPIFSPLWAAGRKEYFATVGRMDLDEDGRDDRALFEEIVHNAGAEIDLWVNDEAQRVPADGKLSARTKFLIVGDIDDPTKFSGIPEKQKLAEDMGKLSKALQDEARLYGTRIVRLNDFLDYIGWKPEQRLWRPADNSAYNLRHGTEAERAERSFQDRTSEGTVSEIYRRNRARQQQESDGTTSGLFKNK